MSRETEPDGAILSTCPGCGRYVVLERATKTIRHEAPVCEVFAAKMQEFGLRPVPDIWAAVFRTR